MNMIKIITSILIILLLATAIILYWRVHRYDEKTVAPPSPSGTALAYFAGGCFWCTESDFEKLPGVREVFSGYSGGSTTNPTYASVGTQTTGHLETVEVRYDPTRVSYQKLVQYFFSHIDPTDPHGQFADQGASYVSAVFYQNAEEKTIAEQEMRRLTESGAYEKPLVTLLLPFQNFYFAEEYHQNYWKKNPVRYAYYRDGSGRDHYLGNICQKRAIRNVPCISAQ